MAGSFLGLGDWAKRTAESIVREQEREEEAEARRIDRVLRGISTGKHNPVELTVATHPQGTHPNSLIQLTHPVAVQPPCSRRALAMH